MKVYWAFEFIPFELNDGKLPFAVELDVTVCACPPLFVQVTVLLTPIFNVRVEGLKPQFGGVAGEHVGLPSKMLIGVPLLVVPPGRVRM